MKRFGSRNSFVLLILLAVFLPLALVVMVQQQTIKQEAAAPATHNVSIINFNMNPTTLTINTGDTVTWTNQDGDAHDVHSTTEEFHSPLLNKGDTWSFTFNKPGTFEYYCTPHKSFMNGYKIIVIAGPTDIPTIAPQATATPTTAPTAIPTATPPPLPAGYPTPLPPLPTDVPAPTDGSTLVGLVLSLHGIGNTGDVANPASTDMSNKSPQQMQRDVSLILIDSAGKTVGQPKGTVQYSLATGDFRGAVDLGKSFTTAKYLVKVVMPSYLAKVVATNFSIKGNTINNLPPAKLVSGDIDGNNSLDVNDYNAILEYLQWYNTAMVRPARKDDAEAIQQLQKSLTLSTDKLGDKAYRAKIQAEGFLITNHLIQETFDAELLERYIVSEHEGKLVGYLRIDEAPEMTTDTNAYWLQPEWEKRYFSMPHACISRLAVMPEARKSGFAKDMLEQAIQKLQAKQVKNLFSFVVLSPVTNTVSLLFHEKSGFERVAITSPRPLFQMEGYQSILYAKAL
jgi:plastocyanin/ribosomal protein S18 acetylase RimI-like enzyme